MTTLCQDKLQEIPIVSIGMPVYNGGKYVRDALNSLLKQTFRDFELIISDNASTDGTEKICREYAARDPRIRFFRQATNNGAMANFKFVLDEARGRYFMWAAHDDLWSKHYLKCSTMILDDENIDFVFPMFKLKSIRFGISRRFNADIFKFIEYRDKKERVLSFLSLHHDSHKCNIVYSLFRSDFLRDAVKIQNIENDGVLGAVILYNGCGKVINDHQFVKRYPLLWPGSLRIIHALFYKNMSEEFELAKNLSMQRLLILFPEYRENIERIFDFYSPYSYRKNFQICLISETPLGR